MRLSGKTAIVTGSGRGIGKATAIALAKEGCNVVVCSRTAREIENTANEIKKLGSKAISVRADVSNSGDVRNLIKKTIDEFGSIGILVNNAGVAVYKPLIDTTEKEYDYVMNVNTKGVFLCTKEVLPHMIKQKSGVIVNISSALGKHGSKDFSAYSASKFGVIGLTESVAAELPSGIKVYAVCPGGVATDMVKQIIGRAKFMAARYLIMKPERIAEKVLELCMPDCMLESGSSVEIGK